MSLDKSATHCAALTSADYPATEVLDAMQASLVASFNERIRNGELRLEPVPCLCGQSDFEALAAYDRYRILQPTVICKACGLVQSNPRMSADNYAEFYVSDAYRALYNPQLLRIDEQAFHRQVEKNLYRFRFVSERLNTDASSVVLEIGCGGGWNLWPHHQAGAKVFGYDLGPTLVSFGRSLGMDLHVGTTKDIQTVNADLIVLSHVVEHFLDPVSEVAEIVTHIKPGGFVYIEVPNARHFCIGSLQNAHTYLFSSPTLKRYMALAGLSPVAECDFGSHLAVLFQASAVKPEPADNDYEPAMRVVRQYDRRQRIKELLSRIGLIDRSLL